MAKKSVVDKEQLTNDLSDIIRDAINKSDKDNTKLAKYLDQDVISEVKSWVGTGSTILDMLISNRTDGGLPSGRMVEIFGDSGSGKSLICGHILAETQKRDGVAVLIDTENAISKEFLKAIGANLSKLMYIDGLRTIESVLTSVEVIIRKVAESRNDKKLVTIVVDSIAGCSTEAAIDSGDYSKGGFKTSMASILSDGLKRLTSLLADQNVLLVCTNQIRDNLSVGTMPTSADNKVVTPGGHALKFYSSVRLFTKKVGKLKATIDGVDEIIGENIEVFIKKNRMSRPYTKCIFRLYFDRGIDDIASWMDMLKPKKIIKQSGAWYEYTMLSTGEIIKFQEKDFKHKVATVQGMKEELR